MEGGDKLSVMDADSESAANPLCLQRGKCIFEGCEDFEFAIGPCMVPANARASHFGRPIALRERLPNILRDYFGTFGARRRISAPFCSKIDDLLNRSEIRKRLILQDLIGRSERI